SLFDYSKYDVDLFLFRRQGLFLPNVPSQVNVIDAGKDYELFDGSASACIKTSVKKLNFSLAANRMKYAKALKSGNKAAVWSCIKKSLAKIDKHYDVAVAYLEGNSIYYCIDCVDADVKIGYIHNDYVRLGLDKDFDRPFFEKLNYLVSVSDECVNVLKQVFPDLESKIKLILNIVSPTTLNTLGKETAAEYDGTAAKKILTVGRFSAQKGYDMAVDAAKILSDSGLDFKWFAIGTGDLQEQTRTRIKELGLEEKFILLGERANPYPYIKNCDIYAQPSYFEGKSIAIDEAKIFAKPIVCTKFPTVYDQLEDGVTALLAEINAQSIAEKIAALLGDEALCANLSENLAKEKSGNEEEIDKFYALLEGKL
ncbi:MAG: glycosyltransferase, partial [Clostridia bacterium]|nr:glycosyltransferase [Clostridia bacterium]